MQFGLSECVAHWGRYRPTKDALVTNGAHISYGHLNERANGIAALVSDARDSRVVVSAAEKAELLALVIGVVRAGKSAVLVNPGLSDQALQLCLSDVGATVMLHNGTNENVLTIFRERGGKDIDVRGAQTDETATFPNVENQKQEWGVLYSSGTTGVPKGIERDHESMITEFLGWVIELGLSKSTSFYIGRPIYYTGGLVLASSVLIAGGTVYCDELKSDDDHDDSWEAFENATRSNRIDWAFFIPDQIRAFLKAGKTLSTPSAPSNILTMGGPISGNEKQELARQLDTNVIESWGNSEALGTITEIEDLVSRPDSIGHPFICDEMCIVDEQVHLLPPGEIGRLAGGQQAGFKQYSNRPVDTMNALQAGLIISEDYGHQDHDGYFYISGRLSDTIIRREERVFLSQVEAQIRNSDLIEECCVVSISDSGQEAIVAVVTPASSEISSSAMKGQLNLELQPLNQIDHLVFAEIPRVPSGKINRAQCREIARAMFKS